jgi:hypothetical protein
LKERVNKDTGRVEFVDPKNNDRVRAAWDRGDPNHWHKFPPEGSSDLRLDDQGRIVPFNAPEAHIPSR